MYIIPAIDILNKKVVRLREGDYQQVTEYDVTLEEMIERYQSYGTNLIHIIDLNGAKNDFTNQQYLFDIIKKTDIWRRYPQY
jgi:phosphoribosylformimino-5-aminoimidazole carboxamide ribotide isomerase